MAGGLGTNLVTSFFSQILTLSVPYDRRKYLNDD